MKKIVTACAIALMTAGVASAQTTGDKYAAGGLDALSNLEQYVADILIDNGVPISCVGSLTMNDIAVLKSIIDGDENMGNKRSRAKAVLERRCGDLD